MGSKISQLNELDTLTGNEEGVVAYQGGNYRFQLKKITSLVSKTDLGLDQVDNTKDKDKIISDLTQEALDGKAALLHAHPISAINGLEEVLDGKAPTEHHHTLIDVDGLDEALDGKAALNHTHEIAGVNGLSDALDGKANTNHNHSINNINGLAVALQAQTEAIQGKAPLMHEHEVGDIEGLDEFVDQKIADAGGVAQVVFPTQEW